MLVGGSHGEKMMYAMGAEFVEVRIHASTREIRLPRIVGAFAAGRLMNTRTAHSQLMGGMIWGIGSALHEATEIDPRNARYVNDNLADYRIPVNADTPSVKVILVSEEDRDVNPARRQRARRTRQCRNGRGDLERRLSRNRHSRPQAADPDRGRARNMSMLCGAPELNRGGHRGQSSIDFAKDDI